MKVPITFILSFYRYTCPSGWEHVRDLGCVYFALGEKGLTYFESKQTCEMLGSRLVEIVTPESFETLREMAMAKNWQGHMVDWHVGATDLFKVWYLSFLCANNLMCSVPYIQEGKWIWNNNGLEVDSNFWGNGEPNNAGEEDCCGLWVRFYVFRLNVKKQFVISTGPKRL